MMRPLAPSDLAIGLRALVAVVALSACSSPDAPPEAMPDAVADVPLDVSGDVVTRAPPAR